MNDRYDRRELTKGKVKKGMEPKAFDNNDHCPAPSPRILRFNTKTTGLYLDTLMNQSSYFPILLTTQPDPDPKFPPDCEAAGATAGKKLSAPSASCSLGSTPPPQHTKFHVTLKLKLYVKPRSLPPKPEPLICSSSCGLELWGKLKHFNTKFLKQFSSLNHNHISDGLWGNDHERGTRANTYSDLLRARLVQ